MSRRGGKRGKKNKNKFTQPNPYYRHKSNRSREAEEIASESRTNLFLLVRPRSEKPIYEPQTESTTPVVVKPQHPVNDKIPTKCTKCKEPYCRITKDQDALWNLPKKIKAKYICSNIPFCDGPIFLEYKNGYVQEFEGKKVL